MSMRCLKSFGPVFLAALIVGCMPAGTDAETEGPEAIAEPEVTEDESIAPDEPLADSWALARVENCEIDPHAADRIRDAENRLADLRLRYGPKHPKVTATIKMLDNLVQIELDECVKHLQAR